MTELKRFSQKCTSFSRANWDSSCAAYGKQTHSRDETKPGHSRPDSAMHEGSRALMGIRRDRPAAVSGTPSDERYEPDDWGGFTKHVRRAGRLYRAPAIGITRVNPLWVYACDSDERPIELPDGLNTAIVMVIPMDYELARATPTLQGAAATGAVVAYGVDVHDL